MLHLLCQPGWACCSPLPLHTPPEGREDGISLASLFHTSTNPAMQTMAGALCHCLCQKTEVWGARLVQTQVGAPHNWARGPKPPCHQAPRHPRAHSFGMLSCKNRLFSKTNHNGGSSCSSLFFVGNTEVIACARISSPRLWDLSRGKPAPPHRAQRAFLLPRKQQARRDGEGAGFTGVYSERQAQRCWLGMAVVGGCPRLPTAHLASPSLPCQAAQPRRVAGIAGEDASLIIPFLSAFSHLPPSLGSASRRWVDGRLSGAAASPTASPACLTKPAQGFLPFWAKCFLLRAQVTGKSLVSGIQSILCPQPIVGTAGRTTQRGNTH